MYCEHCGKQLEDENNFCVHCGEAVVRQVPNFQVQEEIQQEKRVSPWFKYTAIAFGIILVTVILTSGSGTSNVTDTGEPQANLDGGAGNSYDVSQISLSEIKKSVVNIICEDIRDGELSGGSGTMMRKDGYILTANHIFPQDTDNVFVDDETGCLVTIPDESNGSPDEMYWATPIIIPGISDTYDIAFMEIHDVYTSDEGEKRGRYPNTFSSFWDSPKYEQVCSGTNLDVHLGDKVKVLGYPSTSGGLSLTITEGIISAVDEDGRFLTSAKIDSGNSGGLAVSEIGCITGMPIAVREGDYQNLGQIIPGEEIEKFFNVVNAHLE